MTLSNEFQKGVYDPETSDIIQALAAEVVVMLVGNGVRGSGFSIALGLRDRRRPERLLELFNETIVKMRDVAGELEKDRPNLEGMVAAGRAEVDAMREEWDREDAEKAEQRASYEEKMKSVLDRLAQGVEEKAKASSDEPPKAFRVEIPGVGYAMLVSPNADGPLGSRQNPGPFSCYDKLAPDEPFVVLRAKDPLALERLWEWINEAEATGLHEPEKVKNARAIAESMQQWRKNHVERLERALRAQSYSGGRTEPGDSSSSSADEQSAYPRGDR